MLVLAFVSLGSPFIVVEAVLAAQCGGDVGWEGRTVECEVQSGPVPGLETGGASSGSRLPDGWSIDLVYTPGVGGGVEPWASRTPCDASGVAIEPGDPVSETPSFFGIVLIRDGTGEVVGSELGCYGPATGVPAWLPPTRAEIEQALASAPWPPSSTGVDPRVEGLTGLETHLWSETVAAQPISVTVGDATVVGTAAPVLYRWSMGDGATVTATHPGSPANPAATHVYEIKDTYEIVLEIVWQADVEIVTTLPSGGELRFTQTPPLAPVTVAGNRTYQVVEVRSILVPNER